MPPRAASLSASQLNQEGHQVSDCPEAKPQQLVCYNCNEVGHKRPDSPKLNNGGNNAGSRPANGAPTNNGETSGAEPDGDWGTCASAHG
ncbi:hypothetical protein L2E82_04696 [Cichorium intybus]|uniref:Uncharacterized protein n=1 Tax=Cichorium intybus TaxID=13427 RepID=A0ACB9H5E8_CICIN|nr:hypothetical protein L2E82_04696 [Cichorium intybus]